MADQDLPHSVRLTDPRALRGYAHPTRMALVALLRRDGPQTATQAAAAIGESVASCSFHLRQLAKYGLVEAAGGRGREKPWRATAMFTELDSAAGGDPDLAAAGYGEGAAGYGEGAAAAQALRLAVARQYFELMARWLQAEAREPAEWRDAAQLGDTMVHLTAAELAELGGQLRALLRPYLDRLGDPARRPADSRPVMVLNMAFPSLLAAGDARTGGAG
jgi:DNA-binding transcriptional ArsR family regulator